MNNFDNEFEEAIKLIAENMPDAEDLEKPTLFHSMRVGIYLYNNHYNLEVCIAGLLHDLIEDADIAEEEIEEEFGKKATILVLANTKNELLEYKYEI